LARPVYDTILSPKEPALLQGSSLKNLGSSPTVVPMASGSASRKHCYWFYLSAWVMTIFEINKLQIACFMFKVNTQQLPSYFSDLFIQNSALHSHNTRQSSDYHISYSRTKTRQLYCYLWSQNLEQFGWKSEKFSNFAKF